MEAKRAIEILQNVAAGIDPVTGEIVPREHFVHGKCLQRALADAISALEEAPQLQEQQYDATRSRTVRKRGRGGRIYYVTEKAESEPKEPVFFRSGMPWDQEDDRQLMLLSRKHASVRDIALQLRRTPYAVFSRMEKKKIYGKGYGYPVSEEKGPWSAQEIETLRQMVEQGKDAIEIADSLNRPFYNVRMRIEYIKMSHKMMVESGEGDA